VYAPQAVWDRVCDFLQKYPESDLDSTFDFHPVGAGDSRRIGEMSVEFVEMDHPVPTVGSRWTANNRSLFYTADTGPEGDWRQAATDVELMVSEASLQGATEDKGFGQHLTASEAGEIAREVRAKRLVLTHIPPYLDAARSVHEAELTFDRPVGLAVPGTVFDV
jgi:ribonuclease BN (tRNA processing enzyme)